MAIKTRIMLCPKDPATGIFGTITADAVDCTIVGESAKGSPIGIVIEGDSIWVPGFAVGERVGVFVGTGVFVGIGVFDGIGVLVGLGVFVGIIDALMVGILMVGFDLPVVIGTTAIFTKVGVGGCGSI